MSVLCDTNSEKSFYYGLIWKELSENVSIAWYKFWGPTQILIWGSEIAESPTRQINGGPGALVSRGDLKF